MLLMPSWNSSYNIKVLNSEKVILFNENESQTLNGRIFPLLVPLLNGQHKVEELYQKLGSQVFPAEITHALNLCHSQGLVLDGGDTPSEMKAFWHSLKCSWETVQNQICNTQVSITSLGISGSDEIMKSLNHLNIQTVEKGNFQVILTDSYLRAELAIINREAIALEQPWMLVKPVGNTVWIGPIFFPGKSGCWECLRQRLQSNRWVEVLLEQQKGESELIRAPIPVLPSVVSMAFGLAATEIAKAVVLGSQSALNGAILSFDSLKLETKQHSLTRRPQCSVCGIPRKIESIPKPIVLQNCKRQVNSEAGSRSVSPEVTYTRLESHISPITGVVPSLDKLNQNDETDLLHSYMAGHNLALMHMESHFILENMRSRSGGKGTTDIQARVSAVCEAIERYSSVYRGDEFSLYASFSEIADTALHPNEIMHFSDTQYQNRQSWNAAHTSGFHYVPEYFEIHRKIYWAPVWSLTNKNFKYVPSAYCYFGHPDLQDWFFCTCDSNGNAAGNTLEEAILQGFLELVERDSACLFWYNRVQRPGVDLDSFDDPYIQSLQSYYQSIGRSLWVIDITSDLGIPVFATISARKDGSTQDILVAFGAHLTPRTALLRSLTEVNQFLPAVQRRDAQGNTIYWFHEQGAIQWWKIATLSENSYLLPNATLPLKGNSDYLDYSSNDLKTDVEWCVETARQHDLEIFVLDQTQPDINLSVAKVIVPGLRHFWKRFGPGRLYDVPVNLGWLRQPRDEAELNPIGIFF